MSKLIKGKIWTTEDLVMFGLYLIKEGEVGYGLLMIHGPILGLKIGDLLNLRWSHFIDGVSDECYFDLHFKKDEAGSTKFANRPLNFFIQRITTNIYQSAENIGSIDDFIYTKQKNNQVLSTTTLNRELQKLYQQYKTYVYNQTWLELNLRDPKTNSFEIAWARDMVKEYGYSKKAFIAVSKFMGHRTLKNTIELLEIEPRDEIEFRFDLYNIPPEREMKLEETLNDKDLLKNYLFSNGLGKITPEFEKNRDKSNDYRISKEEWEEMKSLSNSNLSWEEFNQMLDSEKEP